MRIIQVLLDPRIGGAEGVAEMLDAEWRSSGIDTEIAYLDPVAYQRTNRASRLRRLRGAITQFNPDVVLSHTELPSIYTRLCAPLSLAVVPVLHSGANFVTSPSRRLLEKTLLRRTAGIIAVGRAQQDSFLTATGWAGSIEVIPNPIRSDIEFRTPRHSRLNDSVVGNIARIVDSKDPFFWCDVADESFHSGLNLDFTWWGPVGESEACKNLVSEIRLRRDSRLRFAGPTEDVPSALRQLLSLIHI